MGTKQQFLGTKQHFDFWTLRNPRFSVSQKHPKNTDFAQNFPKNKKRQSSPKTTVSSKSAIFSQNSESRNLPSQYLCH